LQTDNDAKNLALSSQKLFFFFLHILKLKTVILNLTVNVQINVALVTIRYLFQEKKKIQENFFDL